MRNAARILIAGLTVLAAGACGNKQSRASENQEMSIEGNIAQGQLPPNAQIETLPPDESSQTTSGELNAGDDNPDVNDLGNGH